MAGDRHDLLIETAGIALGLRPDDEHHPAYVRYTAGAELLLQVAEIEEDDERVQQWVAVGQERRDGWRRPEPSREW